VGPRKGELSVIGWIGALDPKAAWAFVLGLVTLFLTSLVSYNSGRRAKVDEVRIAKTHELAQSIGDSFQKVHATHEHLPLWFKENFSAVSFEKGVERMLELRKGLYAERFEEIDHLRKGTFQLRQTLLTARLYLAEPLCRDLDAYIEECRFGWTDAMFFDTYYQELFTNLLDEGRTTRRAELAKKIMSGLRKAVR
jgi:hypothetical protein